MQSQRVLGNAAAGYSTFKERTLMKFDLPTIEDEDGCITGHWFDVISPRRLTEARRETIQVAAFALMEIPEFRNYIATNSGNLDGVDADNPVMLASIIGGDAKVMVKAMSASKHALVLAHVKEWSFGDVTEKALIEEIPGEYLDFMVKTIEGVRTKLAEPSLTEPDPKALPIAPSESSAPI